MTESMVYLMLAPLMVMVILALSYPFILRAKRRKIEENNRIVQQLLDEYTKEVDLRIKFDRAYNDRRATRKVINVDFVDHNPQPNDDAKKWKLVYNEQLGVYQKVRR